MKPGRPSGDGARRSPIATVGPWVWVQCRPLAPIVQVAHRDGRQTFVAGLGLGPPRDSGRRVGDDESRLGWPRVFLAPACRPELRHQPDDLPAGVPRCPDQITEYQAFVGTLQTGVLETPQHIGNRAIAYVVLARLEHHFGGPHQKPP